MKKLSTLFLLAVIFAASCERVQSGSENPQEGTISVSLHDVAKILSSVRLESDHFLEVYDAVRSSSANGYDEEYLMSNLFEAPGTGVGEDTKTKSERSYSRPLRTLIEEYLRENWNFSTKAGEELAVPDAEDYVRALTDSDVQIYWPYFENWDGSTAPVITFDPESEATTNIGYMLKEDENGNRCIEEIVVDEEMAQKRPVWVVNRNEDSGYSSLEMLRRQNPAFGESGEIIIGNPIPAAAVTRSESELRTLIIKTIKVGRQYDTWFSGASEFFFKCGSVDGFKATKEEELRNYTPTVTDFMVVVRRGQINKIIPFNAILVSEWTGQMESVAFLVTEDDGGTRTSWKCGATVKIQSKSYGFEIDIPLNTRDDIVWRGSLSRNWFEKYSGEKGRFGDIEITFDIIGK